MNSQAGSCKKLNPFIQEKLKKFEENLPAHLKSEWKFLSQKEKEQAWKEEFYDVS
ncbi:MAG: hypothetical protein ABIG90_01890 [bacterium]